MRLQQHIALRLKLSARQRRKSVAAEGQIALGQNLPGDLRITRIELQAAPAGQRAPLKSAELTAGEREILFPTDQPVVYDAVRLQPEPAGG